MILKSVTLSYIAVMSDNNESKVV